MEYNKKSRQVINKYGKIEKLAFCDNKLFYHAFRGYIDHKGWYSQTIYNQKIYFVNEDDGYRIYYTDLYRSNAKELSEEALPVVVKDNDKYSKILQFTEVWMYYNSINGLSRVNINTLEFKILNSNDVRRFICSCKGVYFTSGYNEPLRFLPCNDWSRLITITEKVHKFNRHRRKIVFEIYGEGIFTCNPDGSGIIKICDIIPLDEIYIIGDWIYFIDAAAYNRNILDDHYCIEFYDYYRIKIDGTGLKRLKESDPLYV